MLQLAATWWVELGFKHGNSHGELERCRPFFTRRLPVGNCDLGLWDVRMISLLKYGPQVLVSFRWTGNQHSLCLLVSEFWRTWRLIPHFVASYLPCLVSPVGHPCYGQTNLSSQLPGMIRLRSIWWRRSKVIRTAVGISGVPFWRFQAPPSPSSSCIRRTVGWWLSMVSWEWFGSLNIGFTRMSCLWDCHLAVVMSCFLG